jgi:hypothetical protein
MAVVFCVSVDTSPEDVMFDGMAGGEEVVSGTIVTFDQLLEGRAVTFPDTDELVRTTDEASLLALVVVKVDTTVLEITTVEFFPVLEGNGALIVVEMPITVPFCVFVKKSDFVDVALPLGKNVRLVDVLVGDPTVTEALPVESEEVVEVVVLTNGVEALEMLELVPLRSAPVDDSDVTVT